MKAVEIIERIRSIIISQLRRYPMIDAKMIIMRRKALANKGGYPDVKNFNFEYEKNSYIDVKKKVLVATSIGSHLPAMQMETVLAASLKSRGAEVHAFLCDSVLPGCQICEPRLFPEIRKFVNNGPQKDLCGQCHDPAKSVYHQIGVQVHSYSDNLTADDWQKAEQITLTCPVDKIKEFVFEGLKIGDHALAGALRFFARATIDEEPYGEQVLRRYLQAALLTAFSARRLFRNERFVVAVFHHGIYVPQGIIGEVARQEGVRVVNWNPAYRKNCFIFSHGDTYHHTMMTEPVAIWEGMYWSKERQEQTTRYLRSRWEGENDWIRFHEKPYFERSRILEETGCDPEKPIISCLTNVMWDAQLHYPANAFPDMLEWLLFTVRYFKRRPDIQLVIRVHPAEIRGSVPTRQPVVDELKKHFNKLPENVYVVPPESNISTYVLAELSDSVLIYGTKTGVELTSMGIPVIVAGEAWIRNKGVTRDASCIFDYENILEALPLKERLSDEIRNRAIKYAYHFFFRRMIPFAIFEQGPGWPPYRFKGSSLDDIRVGKDSGLDLVCDGILNGTPFIFDEGTMNIY